MEFFCSVAVRLIGGTEIEGGGSLSLEPSGTSKAVARAGRILQNNQPLMKKAPKPRHGRETAFNEEAFIYTHYSITMQLIMPG